MSIISAYFNEKCIIPYCGQESKREDDTEYHYYSEKMIFSIYRLSNLIMGYDFKRWQCFLFYRSNMLKQLAFIFRICVYVWYMNIHACECVHTLYVNAGHFVTYSVAVLFIYASIYLFVCLFDFQSVSEPQNKQFLKLVHQQQGSFCLCLHRAKIAGTSHHNRLFTWVLGIWTRVFMLLQWAHYPLSNLSNHNIQHF